jgi:hypothetical protein
MAPVLAITGMVAGTAIAGPSTPLARFVNRSLPGRTSSRCRANPVTQLKQTDFYTKNAYNFYNFFHSIIQHHTEKLPASALPTGYVLE